MTFFVKGLYSFQGHISLLFFHGYPKVSTEVEMLEDVRVGFYNCSDEYHVKDIGSMFGSYVTKFGRKTPTLRISRQSIRRNCWKNFWTLFRSGVL